MDKVSSVFLYVENAPGVKLVTDLEPVGCGVHQECASRCFLESASLHLPVLLFYVALSPLCALLLLSSLALPHSSEVFLPEDSLLSPFA